MTPPAVPPPEAIMQQMIVGFWVSRAIYAAAKYQLPDLLKDGPKTSDELAAASGAHAPSVYRLLRALASAGLVEEHEGRRFSTTPVFATLESGRPGTMRYFAMAELGQEHYSAWEEFPHSIATGEMAFTHKFKQEVWEYYAQNAEHAGIFNNSMTSLTQWAIGAVIAAYDFTPYRKIIDVGGGHGAFLEAVLGVNLEARGVLFDAPPVIAGVQPHPRYSAAAGDFFKAVPEGGDLYMMKWIIHDWNDEQSVRILSNIRKVMAPGAKVILVEAVLEPPPGNPMKNFFDLNMMVMTGGSERTEAEYGSLYDRAGLTVTRFVPTDSPFSIVEGVAK